MIKGLIKRLLEYVILHDIYKIIFELGGCDAQDNYARGWDDAINTVEHKIHQLLERKFD